MGTYSFNAFAFGGEFDLNKLAAALGLSRKYRWEEPMKLNPVTLAPALNGDPERVYLFYFGCLVFINCSGAIIARFLDGIKQHVDAVKIPPQLSFREEYQLEIDDAREPAITNDYAVMQSYNQAFTDIICFVIAKSVALERIEESIDSVFDEVEVLIANLGQGTLEIRDRVMAKLASSILGFKFTSIAHIMVLDKPESTWDDPAADRLYLTMARLFELSPRYQEIKHKSETLLDMTDVFSSISHARRSARLEWIIIFLIVIEIVLSVSEIFQRHHP
jgi:required for meiotic nuclear division protein 1